MLYALAADIVVLLHFLWILFLIFGAFPGRRYKWIKRIHIAGLSFALIIQFFGWYCPLTYLEVWLRGVHRPAGRYPGSFIIHYVEKMVYVELSSNIVLFMTVFLVLISAWIYLIKQGGEKSG